MFVQLSPADLVRGEFEARNQIAREQERLRHWPYADAVERAFYQQMELAQIATRAMCTADALSHATQSFYPSPLHLAPAPFARRNGGVTVNVRITVNGADVPLWKIKELGDLASALGVPLDVSAVPQSLESE